MSLIAALSLAIQPAYASYAQLRLDPPESLPLGGYTARQGKPSEPGGEPLYARCLWLRQGSTEVAIVSLEMLTVPESLVAKVRSGLPRGTNLFMVATHTHCAPDSQMLNSRMTMAIPGIATYKERWLDWYAERITKSVLSARQAPSNRFDPWALEFNPGLNRPRRPYGYPDPWARIIQSNRKNLISVYAAHATIRSDKHNQTSGDWPAAVTTDGSLLLPGAIGDVSPATSNDNASESAKLAEFSRRWKSSQANSDRTKVRGDIGFYSEPIELGDPDLHPDFARANGIPTMLAKRLLESFAPKEAAVTAVRIGDIVLLGVPGEPTSHLGRRIAEIGRRKALRVWVISHCNGWMGYIVDSADYLLNGYEATLTMYGPGTANRVADAAERMINRVAEGKR